MTLNLRQKFAQLQKRFVRSEAGIATLEVVMLVAIAALGIVGIYKLTTATVMNADSQIDAVVQSSTIEPASANATTSQLGGNNGTQGGNNSNRGNSGNSGGNSGGGTSVLSGNTLNF